MKNQNSTSDNPKGAAPSKNTKPTQGPQHSSHDKGSYTIFQSFSFAFQGIIYALRSERNLRIHSLLAIAVVYFSRYYAFSRTEKCLLFVVIGLVLTCELFNTSIETAIDLVSPAYHALAKIAKDVAAGAVLVSSLASIGVGILLFGDIAIIKVVLSDILRQFYIWIPIVAFSIVLVFLPEHTPRHIAKDITKRFHLKKHDPSEEDKE